MTSTMFLSDMWTRTTVTWTQVNKSKFLMTCNMTWQRINYLRNETFNDLYVFVLCFQFIYFLADSIFLLQ